MALSPNYNWSEPDNSSLVKDGAQAMRTLGDAIDTSVWNVGYGQAGKNKIINGAMAIAQRGTTFTIVASAYTLDRFSYDLATAIPTGTVTQQTFTPGTAPVAGYEAQSFMRTTITANLGCTVFETRQKIEDVRTFAGQTITFSFYAKADAACNLTTPFISQNFGSGGSSSVSTNFTMNSVALTTGWLRYTGTVTVPSISGKTIGTNSFLTVAIQLPVVSSVVRNGTYDYWGWQLEYGSKATPFQTASGGSIQGELAMCRRYLPTFSYGSGGGDGHIGYAYGTNTAAYWIPFDVPARVAPTGITPSGSIFGYALNVGTSITPTFNTASTFGASLLGAFTITAGQGSRLNYGANATILFTGCEL